MMQPDLFADATLKAVYADIEATIAQWSDEDRRDMCESIVPYNRLTRPRESE